MHTIPPKGVGAVSLISDGIAPLSCGESKLSFPSSGEAFRGGKLRLWGALSKEFKLTGPADRGISLIRNSTPH